VYNVLKKIPDDDLAFFGFSEEYGRSDWMITVVMPVPPPLVRFDISVDCGAMRGEDDLTYKLVKSSKHRPTFEDVGRAGPLHIVCLSSSNCCRYAVATLPLPG
jgi:DNA-directed RNA polymerase II subunit RPB1